MYTKRLCFLLLVMTPVFAGEEDAAQKKQRENKENIYRYWLLQQAQMKGEMSKDLEEEELLPELKNRIQENFKDVLDSPFIAFTCPAVEDIRTSQENLLTHDGLQFSTSVRVEETNILKFGRLELNSEHATPRCHYVKKFGTDAGNAIPISLESLYDCIVDGGRGRFVNNYPFSYYYYQADDPKDIQITCKVRQ